MMLIALQRAIAHLRLAIDSTFGRINEAIGLRAVADSRTAKSSVMGSVPFVVRPAALHLRLLRCRLGASLGDALRARGAATDRLLEHQMPRAIGRWPEVLHRSLGLLMKHDRAGCHGAALADVSDAQLD